MSTELKYLLPVEQTNWKIEGKNEVVFRWEYDDGRGDLLKLYEKGKQQQWNTNDRIDWSQFEGIATLGITAGASAPETLVDEVIEAFAQRFDIEVSAHGAGRETIVFNLPRELRVA